MRHSDHGSVARQFLSLEAVGVIGFLLLGALSLCWMPLNYGKAVASPADADPIRDIEPTNERHDQFAIRYDNRCVLWNARDDRVEPLWLLPGANRVTSIASHPTLQWLALAQSDGSLTMYELSTQRVRWQRIDTSSDATNLQISSDGKHLLYASSEGELKVYETRNGKHLWTSRLGKSPLLAACFSAVGDRIFTVSQQSGIVALDIQTGNHIESLPIQCGAPRILHSSPNGRHLAIGTFEGELIVWNLRSKAMERRWRPSFFPISALLFTPNQQELFVSNIVGTLARVAIDRDSPPVILGRHADATSSLATAGSALISACYRGELRVWAGQTADAPTKKALYRRSQAISDNRGV